MGTLIQDLRYTVRILAKAPGFTAVAVLSLALGIAANVSIFTLSNGLILRPLPYPQAERVVQVDRQTKQGPYYGMRLIQFRTYRQQNQSFEYLAAYDILGSGLSLNTGSDAQGADAFSWAHPTNDTFRHPDVVPRRPEPHLRISRM